MAISRADGTYAMIDFAYTGGLVTISATVNGETRTATAYEANPQDLKSPGLQFVRHVATASITFSAVEPPPPPAEIAIGIYRRDGDGKRIDTKGLVEAGTPLVIALTSKHAEMRAAEITSAQGGVTTLSVTPDQEIPPTAGVTAVVLTPDFTPTQPGTYTINATGLTIRHIG